MKKQLSDKIILLLAAALLVGTFGFGLAGIAYANAGPINPETNGQITVGLPESAPAELQAAEVKVHLYRTASVSAEGKFTALGDFAGVSGFDLSDVSTAAKLEELAKVATSVLAKKQTKADAEITLKEQSGRASAVAENLATGLYLLTADDVVTDNSKFVFQPVLVALPQDGNTFWQYLMAVTLKYENDAKESKIIIEKELDNWYDINSGYDIPLHTMFVFEVTAVYNEKTVYNDVLSLDFTEPGKKQIVVEGLPVGADVTVTEVYSGGEYQLKTGDKTQTLKVKGPDFDDDPEEFTDWTVFYFENTLNRRLIVTGGVVNYYEKFGEGWHSWVPVNSNEGTVDLNKTPENAA